MPPNIAIIIFLRNPIYDYFVEKMLLYFRDKDDFDDFKKIDLKKYSKFIDVINNFKAFTNFRAFQ